MDSQGSNSDTQTSHHSDASSKSIQESHAIVLANPSPPRVDSPPPVHIVPRVNPLPLPAPPLPIPDDLDREYGCRYCEKKFSNKQALGGHQNAHKIERAMEKSLHENPFGYFARANMPSGAGGPILGSYYSSSNNNNRSVVTSSWPYPQQHRGAHIGGSYNAAPAPHHHHRPLPGFNNVYPGWTTAPVPVPRFYNNNNNTNYNLNNNNNPQSFMGQPYLPSSYMQNQALNNYIINSNNNRMIRFPTLESGGPSGVRPVFQGRVACYGPRVGPNGPRGGGGNNGGNQVVRAPAPGNEQQQVEDEDLDLALKL